VTSFTATFVKFSLVRKERYFQALEQIFRTRTFTVKTGAHPVKPPERFVPIVIGKGEIRHIDFQRLGLPVCSQYGFFQFVHPGSHQSAFEFQDHFVSRNFGDSQHTLEFARTVPNCGGLQGVEISAA